MKLSEYGCMPRLVDYLRVNEDDEILEIIGKYMYVNTTHFLFMKINIYSAWMARNSLK